MNSEDTPLLVPSIRSDDSKAKVTSSLSTQQQTTTTKTTTVFQWSWKILFVLIWTLGIILGSFMIGFYCRSFVMTRNSSSTNDEQEQGEEEISQLWSLVVPNMYRVDLPHANYGLIFHFVGGACIMIVGPIQLLKRFRQQPHTIAIHRWLGRIFIVCSYSTSIGGFYYLYQTHGIQAGFEFAPIIGFIATSMVGIVVLVATVETYRHAAITKRIDLHQLWALRLLAVHFGNVTARTIPTFLTTVLPSQYEHSISIFTLCTFMIPNLIVAEYYFHTCCKNNYNNNSNNYNNNNIRSNDIEGDSMKYQSVDTITNQQIINSMIEEDNHVSSSKTQQNGYRMWIWIVLIWIVSWMVLAGGLIISAGLWLPATVLGPRGYKDWIDATDNDDDAPSL